MFVENMPDQMQFKAYVLIFMNPKSVFSYTAWSQFVDDGRSFGANTLRWKGKEVCLADSPSRVHDSLKEEKESY